MAQTKGGRPRAGQTLTPEDINVIDAWMVNPNKAAIGRELKMDPDRVARILERPATKTEVERRMKELLSTAGTGMKIAAAKALDVMVGLLDDENAQTRFRAATYVLDRLPDPPTEGTSAAIGVINDRLRAVDERLDDEDEAGE